jgi:gas vesicle protein
MTAVPTHQTRVYRFAVWGDLPDAAVAEMRRAHEERVKEMWRLAPTLQELEAKVNELDELALEVVTEVKAYRQEHRTTQPSKELKEKLKDARKELREARKAMKDEKERIYPIVKPELVKLGEQRKQLIKDTYRPAVDNGLYWANYNFVRERHEAAVQAVRGRRKMGLPSNLRFRHWNGGEGTLVVQLQRQSGQPARTPAVVADKINGKYRNVGFLAPAHDPTHWATLTRSEQRKERIGRLRFRIGSGDEAGMVDVPVFVHRPIPPEADICFMEIKRTRLGRRYFSFVSVVVRLPVTPLRTEGHRVAMHVGWRALSDGGLRVAVVTGMNSMPPEGLHDVVRMHVGWAEIVVPLWYREQMDYVRSLSSIRGKNLDVMKKWFLAWLAEHPGHGIVGVDNIERWRSADRFGSLIERLGADQSLDAELREYLTAWHKQDIHVREIEDNLRAKVIARRNNAFANVAAWLLDTAGLLAIDHFNIARMARRPDIAEKDSEAHQAARSNRVLAAPGRLRQSMIDAAGRRGVQVQTIDGTIAGVHHVCGNELDQDAREQNIMVWCPKCEMMVDQDANALQLLKGRSADVELELESA